MKKQGLRVTLFCILTTLATFFTALTLKAGIGTYACWDALSANISQLTGLKVAHFGMMMNTLCVLLQILMLGKKFAPAKILQIPFVILFGAMVNYFYYDILTFDLRAYYLRFPIAVISIALVGLFLGALSALDLVTLSVETTCNIASNKFSIDYAILRVGMDVLCIVISVALSLIFGLTFTIREGTFIAMFLLGPLEKRFMNRFQKYAEKLRD